MDLIEPPRIDLPLTCHSGRSAWVRIVEGTNQQMTTRAGDRLFLDDVYVGQRFVSACRTVDADEIKQFARKYDPQPFHLSDEGAARSIFGSLAASGWLTAAITMRLYVDSVSLAGGVIGAGAQVDWPRPTRPGDTLQLFSEVESIEPSRSKPDRAIVRVRSETRNQRGEVVQALTAKLIVFRRPNESTVNPPRNEALRAAEDPRR